VVLHTYLERGRNLCMLAGDFQKLYVVFCILLYA